ncbi:MAG TPA: FecR domain-containing protein [bacterium]|nr:FecR domain-containing protein [bacterium]
MFRKSLTLIAIIFTVFAYAGKTFSQNVRIMLAEKEGDVFKWNGLDGRWDDLPLKSIISQGTILKTGEKKSRAIVSMGKKAVLTISENTVLRINSAMFEKEDIKEVKLQLSKGKIWSVVEKLPTADKKFVVETPNTLAGIRGTIFAVEFVPEGKSTMVGVVAGEVGVGSKMAPGLVLLKANMSTVVIANSPPVSPRALDEKERQEWEKWKESIPFSEIGIVGGIAEINSMQIQEASRIVRELGIAKKGSEKVSKDFESIEAAILLFYGDTKSVPGRLKDLLEKPEVPGWKGPYLGAGTNFMDPYGRPYQYRKRKTPGGKEYVEIFTFGLVGAAGATYGEEKKIIFTDKLYEEVKKLQQP